MTEYRIIWSGCPHVSNIKQVMFAEADSAEDARTLAENQIERVHGIAWYTIFTVEETKPVPPGKIISS